MVTKFLLIDDDSDDRELFCEALREIDSTIVCYTAASCRKAIALLSEGEVQLPDVIFLDINMPQMSGWQCLSILKQHEAYCTIPVIMYSTSTHPEDIEKAHSSGALCFFSKPVSFTELKINLRLLVQHLTAHSLDLLINNSSGVYISARGSERNR